MNIVVTLSTEEGLAATVQGALQVMRATERGWVGNDHGGASGRDLRERWAQGIHGQMCEHVVAKALDRYAGASIDGINTADCGGYMVRGTPWETGCLVINRGDLLKHANTPFILVTGHWPRFTVRGWLYGYKAQVPEWWRPDERPASWWVPQSALWSLDVLLDPPIDPPETLAHVINP
jgi:hypothetical protein